MKSIFPAAIDGDFLKLVHLYNDFRMVDGAKPLAVGDVCKAEACVISVINAKEKSSRLKALFIIKANASLKSCHHSCTMDIFRIMRTPTEEPDYVVPPQSDVDVGVLQGERVLAAPCWHFSYFPHQVAGVIQG